MKKIQFLLCSLIVVVAFSSCNPSDDSNNSVPDDDRFSENFGSAVSRDFIGQIIDIYNNPLQGVTIKIGTSTSQTDINGVFIINDANVYQKFAYITAKKPGYIDSSRSMVPTMGTNNVRIMLLSNPSLTTTYINAEETSEVNLDSGTKVKFDGAFEDEEGNSYTGSVQVSLFHLTPSDENISNLMPGMLYAQSETNQEVVLETYGMINVELRGESGEKLNIKKGHTAEITLPIDASQMSTAPNSISLWHFDEERGYWKQDGIATKVGNKYMGEVSHFSWWGTAVPLNAVYLAISFVDSNSNPASNIVVTLSSPGFWVAGYPDNNGQTAGFIPANLPITLNVNLPYTECEDTFESVLTTTVGPFSTSTTLPPFILNYSTTLLGSTIIGNLVKCDGTPVNNGYVLIGSTGVVYHNPFFAVVTNGSFSSHHIYCPNASSFTLKGYDMDNLQQTSTLNYTFTSPVTTVGNLQTCTEAVEYITYQVDNNPAITILNCTGRQNQQNGLLVRGISPSHNFSVMTNFIVTSGVYTTSLFFIEASEVGLITPEVANTLQFNVTQIGAIGDFIDITISGTYQFTGYENHTLTCTAHVIRDN